MSEVSVARDIAELWAVGTPIVFVVTSEEDRAIAACEEAARIVKADHATWSSHRGLDPIDPAAKDPLSLLDAIDAADPPLAVTLLDFHLALDDPRVQRKVRDLLPSLVRRKPIAIVAPTMRVPASIAADVSRIDLPLPNRQELAEILETVATNMVATNDAEARHRVVNVARGLTASQARRGFLRALRADPRLGRAAIEAVVEEKRRLLARDVGVDHVGTDASFESVGGLEGFKAWLDERALAFASEARSYGLEAPRGVLLLGVQGCGKSLAAKCVAARLGVPLLRLDLPRVLGGASAEEGLARAIDAVEATSPTVLWVDEIEKGFAGSSPQHRGDPRVARLLGAFSTWLQERQSDVFVVGTANDVTTLPPELLRRGRFDELFFVDLPDQQARREILAVHLARRGRDPDAYDLASLAERCRDYSGAELEQIVVGALHRAFAASRDLEMADLRRVAIDVVPLSRTYEEQIKALREWARGRARPAGRGGEVVDLFRRAEG